MNTRSIFEFDSYKKAMAYFLLKQGRRGRLSRAAEELKCQPSFLSRVIKSEVHLTLDHAFMLTRFWKLYAEESQYFQTLVEFERAAEPQYKASLATKLDDLKKNHESLKNRIKKQDFPLASQQSLYFSSWIWSALHFLTSISHFQTTKSLAARLGLTEETVKSALQDLTNFDLVRENRGRWVYHSGQFHLPKDSPYVVLHHQNWRSRAVMDSQNVRNDGIHYTTVLTLSHSDVHRLKNLVLDFISESERIAKPSDPEECMVLTCDLFKA